MGEVEYGIWVLQDLAVEWHLVNRPYLNLEAAESAKFYMESTFPDDHFEIRQRSVGPWEALNRA